MIRKVIFQLHWALGITVGFVLVVMSVTGATMAFENEIMRATSAGIMTLSPREGVQRLSPDAILARIREQQPKRRVASLILPSSPNDAARVVFARDPQDADEDRRSYVDPYDGRLLGPATGERFFRTVRALHRWLLLPGDGKGFGRQITGIASVSLIYFALSGLWLRWPRRPFDWRQWFVINLTRSGRSLYRSLHVVIGSWLVVIYLFSGLTGLWWSYDWYKSGVTSLLAGTSATDPSVRRNAGRAKDTAAPRTNPVTNPETNPEPIMQAVSAVRRATSQVYREIVVTIPMGAKPIRLRALPAKARYDQAYDDFLVAPDSGTILKAEPYAGKTTGTSLVEAWLSLHEGSYFGWPGRIVLALSSAMLPLFPMTGWLLYLDRRNKRRRRARQNAEGSAGTIAG